MSLEIPLPEQVTAVSEKLIVAPYESVDGYRTDIVGRYLASPGAEKLGTGRDLLVVAHGMPGSEWRLQAEAKARAFVAQKEGRGALMLMPAGIKRRGRRDYEGAYDLGVDENEADEFGHYLRRNNMPPFRLAQHIRQPFAASDYVRKLPGSSPKPSVHLVGHSYGAPALAYALAKCREERIAPPASAAFLAPFMRLALIPDNDEIGLCVTNTRLAAGETLQVDYTAEERKFIQMLAALQLQYYYWLAQNPLEDHRTTFGPSFFNRLGDLSEISSNTRVRVVLGGKDEVIDERHAQLIAQRTGRKMEDITTVLPEDGHALPSVNFESLIAA